MKNANGNLFGTQEYLPGENLWNAICETKSHIGIPTHKVDEALLIMKKALTDKEFEIACDGFGLNRERLTQKAIGEKYGIDANVVSVIAHRLMEKLQRAPYRGKLAKLVPTSEELYAAFKIQEDQSTKQAALEGQNRRIIGLLKQVEVLEEKNSSLQAEIGELNRQISERDALEAEYGELAKKHAELQAQNARLMEAVVAIRSACNNVLPDAHSEAAAEVSSAAAEVLSKAIAEILGTSMAKRLSAVRIDTLEELTQMTKRALIALKFRVEEVDEIQRRLEEVGLSLRVA